MLDEIHAVMQDTADLQAAIVRKPIKQKMPGPANAAHGATHVVAAVAQMIGVRPLRQLGRSRLPARPESSVRSRIACTSDASNRRRTDSRHRP